MNYTDGKCETCGDTTRYTGELPILCGKCKSKPKMSSAGLALMTNPILNGNRCGDCSCQINLNDKPYCDEQGLAIDKVTKCHEW